MAYAGDQQQQQQQQDYVSVNNTSGDTPRSSEPRRPQSGGGFQPNSGPPPGLGGSAFVPGKIFIGGLDGTTTKETLQDYCELCTSSRSSSVLQGCTPVLQHVPAACHMFIPSDEMGTVC